MFMFCDNDRCKDLDVVAHNNKGIQKNSQHCTPKKRLVVIHHFISKRFHLNPIITTKRVLVCQVITLDFE
jgi:7,8-dihydro-6-hydroxymethylpterin-pyrophosphokinase